MTQVESAAEAVGLQINTSKTKFMAYNAKGDNVLSTKSGIQLEQVHDFQYLDSWVDKSEKYLKVRKALAWKTSNKIKFAIRLLHIYGKLFFLWLSVLN